METIWKPWRNHGDTMEPIRNIQNEWNRTFTDVALPNFRAPMLWPWHNTKNNWTIAINGNCLAESNWVSRKQSKVCKVCKVKPLQTILGRLGHGFILMALSSLAFSTIFCHAYKVQLVSSENLSRTFVQLGSQSSSIGNLPRPSTESGNSPWGLNDFQRT